ncbi:MAG: nucleotidyltransferase [Candidatus Altiarchaeales archaeon ex4484_2]|nr:MAG: nucleotidyltransferase [Candidatus Altiarchaeales archaeon ex4484_2]
MKTQKEIEETLKKYKPSLRERFKVKKMGVFGSCIRGEQKEGSDIDVLVEFEEPIGLLEFVSLERNLSEIIGERVDLVMKTALKPRIGRHILQEVHYI